MVDGASYLLLFVVGVVAGTLNVLAGGGSFLTLPLLIFLGVPATVANGTNRVAIALQNASAVWGFHRHRVLDWTSALWAALPAVAGGVLGTWIALVIGDEAFQRALALLMVGVSLWTLWDPFRGHAARADPADAVEARHRALLAAGFFLTGIYGGFVQAGVGFLILAVTSLGGLDLVRGNAVKVLAIFAFTTVSLALFAWQGKVLWGMGLVLALGTVAGAQLGVRLTVLKGHRWVRRVVTVMVIVFALKLWLD